MIDLHLSAFSPRWRFLYVVRFDGYTITAPEGKSYKSIMIADDMPQASSNGSVIINFNGVTVYTGTNFITAATLVYTRKRVYLFTIIDSNVVGIVQNGTINQIGFYKDAEFGQKRYSKGPITEISYCSANASVASLPAGTKVSIWGR